MICVRFTHNLLALFNTIEIMSYITSTAAMVVCIFLFKTKPISACFHMFNLLTTLSWQKSLLCKNGYKRSHIYSIEYLFIKTCNLFQSVTFFYKAYHITNH